MGRFTVVVDDDIDTEFRIKAVKRRIKLKEAFELAMKIWIEDRKKAQI
jgi:hypothetical protein